MSAAKLPFRKKLALELFRRYRKNESRLHPLKYILWECTLRCNLQCLHCGSECKKEAAVKDMPAEDFLKALDELKGLVNPHKTMIVLTGGEALVRKDLEQIGQQLYAREFPWGLVTNGMLLDEQRLQSLLRAGLRSVTVSLDGLEQSHNWLRGATRSFQQAFHAIQLLTKTPGIRFDVATCVNRKNFDELPQLKEMLWQTGVKEWRIFTIFPIGRAKTHEDLQLEPQSFKVLFDFIRQTRKEMKIKLNYGCEGFLGSYEGDVRDNLFYCRAGISIASVLADGSISACPNLRANFIQGSIYKDSFADVWQNRYQVFRDRSWTKTGSCASCKAYRYCEGNGMHLHDEQTGELLFCHLKRLEAGCNEA
ncbi:MAG: TIGR04133 family radical SAM/SPASM protein [Prevotellaceae bacterium]|jgi:radical SAM enzyme (rSAM/lipoprotein system)|nr:TIGR04133 family radical SAM/SPASM protein [Prevotellaceae bacterium]